MSWDTSLPPSKNTTHVDAWNNEDIAQKKLFFCLSKQNNMFCKQSVFQQNCSKNKMLIQTEKNVYYLYVFLHLQTTSGQKRLMQTVKHTGQWDLTCK